MPRYRVTAESFVGGRLVQVGDVIEYDGVPGFNLEPADATAKRAKDAASKSAARNVNTSEFVQDMAKAVPED
ncbi:hypothetical protein [Gluconobacter oxydans]|uniref:hypothetical protein n=1 Tax=Gluconobacter oxydans TaxID=442 RepID=UPI000AD48CD7|nr:hypothetical protein [Gluconobacter oxydans]